MEEFGEGRQSIHPMILGSVDIHADAVGVPAGDEQFEGDEDGVFVVPADLVRFFQKEIIEDVHVHSNLSISGKTATYINTL